MNESEGWMVEDGIAQMPIARSLTPMRPRMIYFHTNGNGIGASTPQSMFDNIERQINAGAMSVIIPTFQVGLSATAQYKSIFVRPSTQLDANPFSVGIETADHGATNNPFGGVDKEPWNEYQLGMLAKIAAFCARIAGLSLDRADLWNGNGCEGHCASNLIPGDKRGFTYPNVTTSHGKICPGHARLGQIAGILTAAKAILAPLPPAPLPIPQPDDEEDGMTPVYKTIVADGKPQFIAKLDTNGWSMVVEGDAATMAAARQDPDFGGSTAVWTPILTVDATGWQSIHDAAT